MVKGVFSIGVKANGKHFFWTNNYCHHRKWLQLAAPNQSFLRGNERVKLSKPYVYLLVRNRQLENILVAGWNASFRSERGGSNDKDRQLDT
jgi:hypothetical protein